MIFNFGVRRSGTWWLQRIVSAHPDVSYLPSETALFSDGLPPLFERFHHGVRDSPGEARLYVERDRLLDAARDFCDRVFEPFLEPGARYLAERSPTHTAHVDLIAEVYPDARFVHIIRDGRDVARSLLSKRWGPESLAAAATEWRDSILRARTAPAERYREIHYETMLTDPATEIRNLYAWLGLRVDDDVIDAALAEARLPRNQDRSDGRLMSGKWRDHFSAEDVSAFEEVAGGLLAELGYGREAAVLRPRAAERLPSQERPMLQRAATRVAGRARRLGRAVSRSNGRAGGLDLSARQRLVDGFLAALHNGAGDELRALMSGNVALRTVSATANEVARGHDDVTAALIEDSAWRGRQVLGDVHPGAPSYSVVLGYELPDGRRANRVLEFLTRDDLVERITLYRFGG